MPRCALRPRRMERAFPIPTVPPYTHGYLRYVVFSIVARVPAAASAAISLGSHRFWTGCQQRGPSAARTAWSMRRLTARRNLPLERLPCSVQLFHRSIEGPAGNGASSASCTGVFFGFGARAGSRALRRMGARLRRGRHRLGTVTGRQVQADKVVLALRQHPRTEERSCGLDRQMGRTKAERQVNKRKTDAWVRSATLQLRLDGSLKHRSGRKILRHGTLSRVSRISNPVAATPRGVQHRPVRSRPCRHYRSCPRCGRSRRGQLSTAHHAGTGRRLGRRCASDRRGPLRSRPRCHRDLPAGWQLPHGLERFFLDDGERAVLQVERGRRCIGYRRDEIRPPYRATKKSPYAASTRSLIVILSQQLTVIV